MTHFYLFSWVATKDSAAPEGGSEISIEKLETQLNTLKTMFAEKQKLVSDLEAYGPEGEAQLNTLKTICLPKSKHFSQRQTDFKTDFWSKLSGNFRRCSPCTCSRGWGGGCKARRGS